MTESRELALKAARILDEKGANHIVVLDVGHLTSITDYFVIANGRNVQSVHTLAEDLEDKLAEQGFTPRRKEGQQASRWIVLDYAHVIVHIFHPEEQVPTISIKLDPLPAIEFSNAWRIAFFAFRMAATLWTLWRDT